VAKLAVCPLGEGATYARMDATMSAIASGRIQLATKTLAVTVTTSAKSQTIPRDRHAGRKSKSSGTRSSSRRAASSSTLRTGLGRAADMPSRPAAARANVEDLPSSGAWMVGRTGGARRMRHVCAPGSLAMALGSTAAAAWSTPERGAKPPSGGGGMGTRSGGSGGAHDRGLGARRAGRTAMSPLFRSGPCAARSRCAAKDGCPTTMEECHRPRPDSPRLQRPPVGDLVTLNKLHVAAFLFSSRHGVLRFFGVVACEGALLLAFYVSRAAAGGRQAHG
jgi:hypothetical protein